ncbi:hypothetical protein B0O80DRAFT_498341 [Mortierella sp. GBAus27b]|nr:hypothetical protein B0O80DRAFT_498341 [Mortierella sp. GBAus27b]
MRIATFILGVILAVSTGVLAQEIIAPEEWFESIKLSRRLVNRQLHNKNSKGRHHHHRLASTRNRSFKLNKRLLDVIVDLSSSPSPVTSRPERRIEDVSLHSELEHRATQ